MKKFVVSLLTVLCLAVGIFPLAGCKKSVNVHTRYEIIAEYIPENRTVTGVAHRVTVEMTIWPDLGAPRQKKGCRGPGKAG